MLVSIPGIETLFIRFPIHKEGKHTQSIDFRGHMSLLRTYGVGRRCNVLIVCAHVNPCYII